MSKIECDSFGFRGLKWRIWKDYQGHEKCVSKRKRKECLVREENGKIERKILPQRILIQLFKMDFFLSANVGSLAQSVERRSHNHVRESYPKVACSIPARPNFFCLFFGFIISFFLFCILCMYPFLNQSTPHCAWVCKLTPSYPF